MGGWGNTDVAGNSAIFAPALVNKAPNATERDKLYGNTTANAYFGSGETIGQFGVSYKEKQAQRSDRAARAAGPGWQLRTTGSGGRAGRVRYETLVAMRSLNPAGDDDTIPDFSLILTNPVDVSANAGAGEVANLYSYATSVPAGATITYKWQVWDGAAWTNTLVSDSHLTGYTANVLQVVVNAVANATMYRQATYASGATTKYSEDAVLHVLPDIEFLLQANDATANADADEIAKFEVEANAASVAISYQWQFANTEDGFENLSNAGAYSNTATVELSVLANTAANGEVYRCAVSVANTLLVHYSDEVTLTITAS